MTKPTENELFEQWFWNDNSDDYNKPEYEMGLRAWTAHAELADKEKAELQAQINELREALEAECGGRCNAEYNPCHARQALAKTAPQCLIEHDNELLDKVINSYSPDDNVNDFFDKIKALKG